MDDEQYSVMKDLLTQLSLSLSLATSTLETVVRRDSLARPSIFRLGSREKKAAWVWKKDALDAIISDLEAWQRRFDPSWFLLIKIADPIVDRELAKARTTETSTRGRATATKTPLSVAAGLRNVLSPVADRGKSLFLPDSQLEWRDIPFSDAKAGRRLSDNDSKWYIVDTIEVGPTTRVRDLARDVRILATKLTQADPLAFGLLSCKGVIALVGGLSPSVARSAHSRSPSRQDYSHFQFVFRIPDGMEALQSLRQLLLNSDLHISLSRKVRIARELVKAVNYVHTFAFVHKNVRPESVLCFEDPEASRSHAFLVGFDAFRGASTGTMMSGDTSWDHNIYRHPHRQGMDPSEKYPSPPQTKFGKFHDDFQAWCKQRGTKTSSNVMSFQLKDYLVEQAHTRLASRAGDKYSHVAVSCLTCLDDDNEDFGMLEVAESDDAIAVNFIEKVMKSLDEISL